jgi:REP element-mobilizing transposase RayT
MQNFSSKSRFKPWTHGGQQRNKREGRGRRPLSISNRASLHLIFKIEKRNLRQRSLRSPQCFVLVRHILKKYARHFQVRIGHVSIQHDHIHLCVQTSRRSQFQHFFRVVPGQIAQQFQNNKWVTDTPKRAKDRLWKERPWTRVVWGVKALLTLRNYIQLNEKEVTGTLPYRKQRLKGLSAGEWEILWT